MAGKRNRKAAHGESAVDSIIQESRQIINAYADASADAADSSSESEAGTVEDVQDDSSPDAGRYAKKKDKTRKAKKGKRGSSASEAELAESAAVPETVEQDKPSPDGADSVIHDGSGIQASVEAPFISTEEGARDRVNQIGFASSLEEQQRHRHVKPDTTDEIPYGPGLDANKKDRGTGLKVAAIIIIVLLAIGVGCFVYFGIIGKKSSEPYQNALSGFNENSVLDSRAFTSQKTQVPALTDLFGKTSEDAVAVIGHGATVSSVQEAIAPDADQAEHSDGDGDNRESDEGENGSAESAVKKVVTVTLSSEPSDSRTGAPFVTLGLDEEGKVVQVGYSVGTSLIGYGPLSFADAVSDKRIVEDALSFVGVSVPEGSVALPASSAYTTYLADGLSLVKESYAFKGNSIVQESALDWEVVLTYDYITAKSTGSLADSTRQIFVTLTPAS